MDNKIENMSIDSKENQDSFTYIFKIILIGDASCGKTSLINRYVTKCFNDKYICTIGVDFMMKSIIHQDQTIKLQIWDTAGMEKYKQITTSYYRGAQAAIIVFDLTNKNSFISIKKWIEDYSQFCNPIFQRTIFLVGNKSDLIERREVTIDEIESYRKINNIFYFETSAKTGDNVEELFIDLTKSLHSLYKNNINSQISEAVKMRRSTLNNADKFQNIIEKEHKKKRKCNC